MSICTVPVNLLVEGKIDEVVAARILAEARLSLGRVYGGGGKSAVVAELPKYNQAARFSPWVAVVDLDRDAECAPPYVHAILPQSARYMQVRVAARAIEAWLLADAERLAQSLHIPESWVPVDPDSEPDPKTALVNLARRSRRRSIRDDLVPRAGSGARVGRGYSGRLIEFVCGTEAPWRPRVAAQRSDSLRCCLEAVGTFHHILVGGQCGGDTCLIS
jgi:hypothetical protein